jgi:hypothetical protein
MPRVASAEQKQKTPFYLEIHPLIAHATLFWLTTLLLKDAPSLASSLARRLQKRVSLGLEKTILIREDNKPNRPILTTNQKLKFWIQTKILRVIGLKTLPTRSHYTSVLTGGEIL